MNKDDFKPFSIDFGYGYEDCWFDVVGETMMKLTKDFMDQYVVRVEAVVYHMRDRTVGVRRILYHDDKYDEDVVISQDAELNAFVKEFAEEFIADIQTKYAWRTNDETD